MCKTPKTRRREAARMRCAPGFTSQSQGVRVWAPWLRSLGSLCRFWGRGWGRAGPGLDPRRAASNPGPPGTLGRLEVPEVRETKSITFQKTARFFQSGLPFSHSHQQCMKLPISPHPLQQSLSVFLITAIWRGVKWHHVVVLICISLMVNDTEHLFMCSLAILYNLWRTAYFRPLPNF